MFIREGIKVPYKQVELFFYKFANVAKSYHMRLKFMSMYAVSLRRTFNHFEMSTPAYSLHPLCKKSL